MSLDVGVFKTELDANGQSHLYQFWNDLSDQDKANLFNELRNLNVDRINEAYTEALKVAESFQSIDGRLMCPDPCICGHADSLRTCYGQTYAQYLQEGLTAISEKKVAVVLMAGGQGTRLGSTNPKGMYNIGLPSGRSLFQLQAERLLNLCKQVSSKCGQQIYIPWFIMTSDATQEATEDFFIEHNCFGYSREHIIFFEQLNIPVLNLHGKILMKNKGSLCWSPEGNGGLYRALSKRGILHHMRALGVEYVHIYGVDNALIRMADPAFIGFCIAKTAECAVKVVEKVEPTEPIGVVGVVDGHFQVVEYSEMSPSTAAQLLPMPPGRLCAENVVCCGIGELSPPTPPRRRLLYSLGNICNHFMTRDFLERACRRETEALLPYHVARKKVAHLDIATGQFVADPPQPNALKLEKFIFDVFRFAHRFSIWEVDRSAEFAPLKNGPGGGGGGGGGKDCPETCRAAILNLHASWAKAAGGTFASGNLEEDFLEVSPLVSLEGENLDCLKGLTIRGGWRLELRSDEAGHEVPTLIPISL